MFNKVTIIGVGLIGGSIGLAVRKNKIAKKIIGVCRHKASLRNAKQIRAIDQGGLNYKDAVKDADLVILATPVNRIIKIGKEILPYLKKGSVVTDVGSTKEKIVMEIEKALPKNVFFVGAHPLAGSEKRGVASARADLFAGAMCILTKTKATNPLALKKIVNFWQRIGCRTSILSPQRHDKTVALVSHLPHLVAAQLVKAVRAELNFASSGFFDTTRIASSNVAVWIDIFLTNQKFVLKAIDTYIGHLKLIRGLIRRGNSKRLSAEFKSIKKIRDAWQTR